MKSLLIDPIDDLLRLDWLEQVTEQQPTAVVAMQHMLTTHSADSVEDSRLGNLRNRLMIHLLTPSLGELLEQAIQAKTTAEVTAATGLSTTMVEQLQTDELYPTQVPVMMMKRLMNWLAVSAQQAESALQKTAERFCAVVDPITPQYGMAPLGRKAFRNDAAPLGQPGTRSRDLYTNPNALRIYLNRLAQEMA